jgi:predicted kinase
LPEAVIFIGLQGAGKTTLYNERFAATHAHVSLDVAGTRERERKLLDEYIAADRSFVVDNTNLLRRERALYIAPAMAAGYRITAYFFKPNVRVSIGRNNHRTDKKPVAVPAILAAMKRLEPPDLGEGFDELIEL